MNATTESVPRANRYHRIDGWRGYRIPRLAIVGASDTGTWADSPAPTPDVKAELRRFQVEALRPAGIRSRTAGTHTTNVFAGKRWLVVDAADFSRAAQIAVDWLEMNRDSTHYIHDADLDVLGYVASRDPAAREASNRAGIQ